MTTAPVLGATGAPGSSAQRIGNQPSTDTFLQLLVAQLRTQNPLEPQKGTEFVTHLAPFAWRPDRSGSRSTARVC